MDLLTPDIGLLFWTFISFAILFFVLKKFAWKPIVKTVNDRENSIREALASADAAKREIQNLTADNEKLLKEARVERDAMMKEARELKTKMIADAKEEAKVEGAKMIVNAQAAIQSEKKEASVVIGEKV